MGLVLAFASQAASIGCLFYSWRSQQKKPLYRVIAAFLFTVSIFALAYDFGAEFGTVFALAMPLLIVIPFIVFKAEQKKSRPVKAAKEEAIQFSAKGLAKHSGLFVLYIFVLGILSAYASIAICYQLPLDEINQMSVATFLYPCLWAGLILYSHMSQRKRGPILLSVALTAYSALSLYLMS